MACRKETIVSSTINIKLESTYQLTEDTFLGLIIIDMEHFGATWAQNFNAMEINHLLSKMKVKREHPEQKSWEIMHHVSTANLIYNSIIYVNVLVSIFLNIPFTPSHVFPAYLQISCML